MSVKVSGPVLSSLFFEQNNSNSDVEGFLIGQVYSHVTNTVTDTQMNSVKEETVTYVHAFVPCSGLYSWYRSSGAIITEKIKAILKDKQKEVVGWYRFRRNTPDTLTLREHLLHRHLVAAFPGVLAQNFLLFLSTCSANANGSTFTFDHSFLTYNGRSFKGVPVSIINLGDSPQSQYRHQPSNAINSEKGRFAQTVKSFQSILFGEDDTGDQFCDQQGKMHSVTGVQTFNSVIHQQLSDLCSTVAVSEKQLGLLQQDIEQLEKQLEQKNAPPPPSPPLQRRNCQRAKAPPATAPAAKTRAQPLSASATAAAADLIMLDHKPLSAPAPVSVHHVPIMNPHLTEQAPGLPVKSKMAANFDSNTVNANPGVKASANAGAKSAPPPVYKSTLEPVKSKTSAKPEEKKSKDSFSFVDDLLAEHKTLSKPSKHKPVTTTKSLEESGKVPSGSNSQGQMRKSEASWTNSSPRDVFGDGPSTAFHSSKACETDEMELSSSPTF